MCLNGSRSFPIRANHNNKKIKFKDFEKKKHIFVVYPEQSNTSSIRWGILHGSIRSCCSRLHWLRRSKWHSFRLNWTPSTEGKTQTHKQFSFFFLSSKGNSSIRDSIPKDLRSNSFFFPAITGTKRSVSTFTSRTAVSNAIWAHLFFFFPLLQNNPVADDDARCVLGVSWVVTRMDTHTQQKH